ncbi:MAG TPA: hypothetical protein PKE36_03465 [Chiayiivirga sp.]|nr:hypothetical protein [Chiayiivirga sp.]
MSRPTIRLLLQTAAVVVFGLCLAAPVMAQKKASDLHAKGASAFTSINGNPLTVRVGDNNSFQVFNAAIPGTGQFYPEDSLDTGAMGWIVQVGGVQYAPTLEAGGSIGAATPYSGTAVSAVSGSGTSASPFQVTVDGTLGASGITARQVVSYVNGQNYYSMRMTLTNGGAAAQSASVFLGGDIYLAGDDAGIPTRQGASNAVGGSDCGATPSYFILFIPQTPVTAWTGAGYDSVWSQIGAGALDNALATGCIDNGAALQWNRSIPAGGSVTLEASVSFGDIPDIVVPVAPVNVMVPASSHQSLLLMLLAMMGAGWLVLRRR